MYQWMYRYYLHLWWLMCQIYVKKDLGGRRCHSSKICFLSPDIQGCSFQGIFYDQSKTNCSNATNASVNANIQQPKSIKQFPCKYPCGNCKNAVTWKTPGVCWYCQKSMMKNLVVRKCRSTTIHYVNLDRFGYSYLNNLYDTTYHIGHSRYL
jgi:hypothetical protein